MDASARTWLGNDLAVLEGDLRHLGEHLAWLREDLTLPIAAGLAVAEVAGQLDPAMAALGTLAVALGQLRRALRAP